jgi:hypothetical protein
MKRHPRDPFIAGRARINMHNEDGTPTVAAVPTKTALLLEIAKILPSLEIRRQRLAQMAMARAEHEKRMAAAAKGRAKAPAPKAIAGGKTAEAAKAKPAAGKKGGKR